MKTLKRIVILWIGFDIALLITQWGHIYAIAEAVAHRIAGF